MTVVIQTRPKVLIEAFWWEEPGHAYLMVPLHPELRDQLGGEYYAQVIADGSRFSWRTTYKGQEYAALEEDCDAFGFLRAADIPYEMVSDLPTHHSDHKP